MVAIKYNLYDDLNTQVILTIDLIQVCRIAGLWGHSSDIYMTLQIMNRDIALPARSR